MARKYDVTRNFDIYAVTMVLYNQNSKSVEEVNIKTVDKNISKKALERYVKINIGGAYTLVQYNVKPVESVMYGMTSAMFRKYGVRLNPENRQPYADDTTQYGTQDDTEEGTQE